MKRRELVARLRRLYVAHQERTFPYDKGCEWCDSRMARVMEVVDEYVAALSAGPPATRYRRGSIIRQARPHDEYPQGARRWRVHDIEGDNYFVQALFSDGSPMFAYWNIVWCEAATELERQDDEVGRIDMNGDCKPWPPVRKVKVKDDASEADPLQEDS